MLHSVPKLHSLAEPLPARAPDPARVAVLLNKNARRVTAGVYRDVVRVVGRDHVFYSRSLEEAESFAREIVQRGYGTVVCGGGDGTLCRTVNLINRYVEESNAWRLERFRRFGERQPLIGYPRFAVLKLGTGNGLRHVVGASNPMRDLRRIVDFAPSRVHQVPLIESDGQYFFFGGLGYDSVLLNDYNRLKEQTKNPVLRPIMHSVMGYFAAASLRTIPSLLTGPMGLRARVTTRGRAFYVDPRRGDRVEELDAGSTLFEGPASLISAGTTPYFGFGLRVFPFSGVMPGYMNLRIAQMGPVETVLNLPGVWRGSYRNPRTLHDFLATDVHVELENPFPFQHSGDAQGMRKEVSLKVSSTKLDLVDLYPPRKHG